MRAIFEGFLALTLFMPLAHAENAITFSPALPRPWTQVSSQIVPATNPISQSPLTTHITVVENATNLQSMMISVIPQVPADAATNHLAVDASNWLRGVLNGIPENHATQVSKFAVKTEKKQQVMEASFTVQLRDAVLCGTSRYSISNTNAIGWVAFGPDPSIETNKVVLRIAASIRVRK
ncbi:MAG TPA: hypothetical protein VHC44_18610 [Verrucomicrobiae bacterium]|nr:hypothetical protein [Verrucomicrobiae bacterium]